MSTRRTRWNRIVALIVAVGLAAGLTACSSSEEEDGLLVYNAQHESLTKEWIDAFTKETGIKVTYRQGGDTADDATKTMTVRRNGEVVKTMPISMGKAKTPTDNGNYIIGDRYSFLVMDSSTYGVPFNSPDGYRTEVEWATQMSYSGIYVHSAPWSVGSQGIANVSHGCLNVNPANARWFYDNTRRGDIVEVINTTGPTLSGTDGLGDWNIPWEQWKAGNANL